MNSLYHQRLTRLKKELSEEVKKRKKKRKKFTANQLVMIDFINGVTPNATFFIKDMKIVLKKGWSDGKSGKGAGFKHILEKHYCKGCDGELTLSDILNIDLVAQHGIELQKVGVSNPKNKVLHYISERFNHKLVLRRENENELVVTFYALL